MSDIGETVSYSDAILLTNELLRETGSHLYATLADQDLAGSQAEIASILHAEGFLEVHRDRERSLQPLQLPKPWHKSKAEKVSQDEFDELYLELEKRSALSRLQ